MSLRVSDLHVRVGAAELVRGVSLEIGAGARVGLIGESGSGKSTLALAILRLLPEGLTIEGKVCFQEADLLSVDDEILQSVRGQRVGVIFQDPYQSFSPVYRIENQMRDAFSAHAEKSEGLGLPDLAQVLREVNLQPADKILNAYPHQLSGGQLQRLSIALVLALEPEIVILDEPTTALDAVTQEEILTLLKSLQSKRGFASLVISHDFHVIRHLADQVYVIYCGEIVEIGDASQMFSELSHPYTRGLLDSIPLPGRNLKDLSVIAGNAPSPRQVPSGCPFHPRCPIARGECSQRHPKLEARNGMHYVRCPYV